MTKACAWMVVGAVLLTACGGSESGAGTAESTEHQEETIIGGAPASEFPEAAYLDIDFTSTGGYLCSAALVAPSVVLTAGHCVDGHALWEVHVGSETRFSTHGITLDWAEQGAEIVNPNHHDVGLVFLDQAIVLAGYPTLASGPLSDGAQIVNVGRVNDGAMTNGAYAATSTVNDGATVGYPLDYVSNDVIQPGDSGGPDYEAGTHRIVAVNSGAGGGVEVLARVDLVSTWIEAQIQAHGGYGTTAPGTPPPSDAGEPSEPGAAPDAGAEPTCQGAAEHETNDTWATAEPFASAAVCGALATNDEDWFAITTGPGRLSLELAPSGDATFAVGQAMCSTCVPTITGLRSFAATAVASQTWCVRVTSKAQAVQHYQLTRSFE